MAVLVNKVQEVIVQGFTGGEGTFHATDDRIRNQCSR